MLSRSCRNIYRNFSTNRVNGQALVTVWWDSSCPLCTKEISLLKRLDKQNNIDFIDLFQSDNPYAMVTAVLLTKRSYCLDSTLWKEGAARSAVPLPSQLSGGTFQHCAGSVSLRRMSECFHC